eukprot:scaffold11938_cov181-Skeletonema_menzelii.AAC.4
MLSTERASDDVLRDAKDCGGKALADFLRQAAIMKSTYVVTAMKANKVLWTDLIKLYRAVRVSKFQPTVLAYVLQ